MPKRFFRYVVQISIHALREESDGITVAFILVSATISIHALREESDVTCTINMPRYKGFQSTLSVRRATFIYYKNAKWYVISIHALREESDHHFQKLKA